MDTRPTIFIGSSSEGLAAANALEAAFGDKARVEVWNSGQVFSRNKAFFQSLLDESSLFDFAILVFTSDDQTLMRNELHDVARDNVLFEFGLFLGRQGPRRAIALVQDSIRVPTDFSGIHFDRFSIDSDGKLNQEFEETAHRIANDVIQYHNHTAEFTHLPSTALAIGYFNNFIVKVCDELDEFNPVEIAGEQIAYKDFSLTILIADDLRLVENKNLKGALRGLDQVKVTSSVFRDFPFYVQAKPDPSSETLDLFDIPTTMSSSKEAVRRIFKEEYVGVGDLQKRAEEREIANFEKTLGLLLDERPFWKPRVKFQNLSDYLNL